MIITAPEDFALLTALYRSSVDGRRFMYEAIIHDDLNYDIPDKFTSRTAEILKVYLKSLGVRMDIVEDETDYIRDGAENDIVTYAVKNREIMCTKTEMYYIRKLVKIYRRYIKDTFNDIRDSDEIWEYLNTHLTFKKKYLTDNIINIFNKNLEVLIEEFK